MAFICVPSFNVQKKLRAFIIIKVTGLQRDEGHGRKSHEPHSGKASRDQVLRKLAFGKPDSI